MNTNLTLTRNELQLHNVANTTRKENVRNIHNSQTNMLEHKSLDTKWVRLFALRGSKTHFAHETNATIFLNELQQNDSWTSPMTSLLSNALCSIKVDRKTIVLQWLAHWSMASSQKHDLFKLKTRLKPAEKKLGTKESHTKTLFKAKFQNCSIPRTNIVETENIFERLMRESATAPK